MNHYKTTVVKDNPHYVDKYLLLSNKKRDGLFKTQNDEIIGLRFDTEGLLRCFSIKNGIKKRNDISLRRIGVDYLDLCDPPVKKVLKYLITPEMEIERIFNCTRWKYLRCIYISNFKNPSKKICSDHNRAFQSLAGITVYQGNVKNRVDNDSFWKNAGFTIEAKSNISFEKEINDLDFIINYFKWLRFRNYNRIYAELIAIKPGFHESYIHDDYFDQGENYRKESTRKDSTRDIVFKLLRGYGGLNDFFLKKLKPYEINRNKYFSYASCSVTEGPFVFRKKLGLSYFDEIRKIGRKEDLEKSFHIFDYYRNEITTIKELEKVLEETQEFKRYMNNG